MLRPLSESDTARLQAVYQEASDYFERTLGYPPPPEQARHELTEAAADEGRYLLGIYLEERMIGVLDLRLADPGPFDVRLGLLLLTPDCRRQGLGSWALRILEEWLRKATPTEAVVLTVLAHDYAAQSFFRAHGYRFTGQATRVAVGNRRPRLLFMRKELGNG